MAVWGKFFGGVAGFAVGGPMGAALGTALGHAADRGTLLNGPAIGWTDKWRDRARPDPYG
ncbi:MAG: molecular chaperone DjlA, partial [Acetobacter sp.]|nr:molecular chaperone DjlA [Acetobacter sp.]